MAPAPTTDQESDTSAGAGPSESTSQSPGRETLVVYLKGLAMGTAATVPGVSGGTIALIVGIYDRFIRALAGLDVGLLWIVGGIHSQAGRERFRDEFRRRDISFLFVLFLGIVTAILSAARVVQYALASHPGPTFAFFGGLIGASAVVLADRSWLTEPPQLLAGLAGFVVAFVVAGASGTGLFPETLPMVFVAATLAVSGMVLPGLSGSFILLLLGQYEYLTGVLTDTTDAILTLLSGGDPVDLLENLTVLGTGVLGAVVGFVTTAHVVGWALERYPAATFAFLVSLMFGAIRYPVIRVSETTASTAVPVAIVVGTALLGAMVVLVLDRYTDDLEYDQFGPLEG